MEKKNGETQKILYRPQDKIREQLEDNNIDKSRKNEDDINPHGFNFGFK
jgi:hypothetical protein